MKKKQRNGLFVRLRAIFKVHSPRKGVLRCAILSRCLIIAISSASNFLIPDHKATDVFIRPIEDEAKQQSSFSVADCLVQMLLGGLARWDAQHFLHIAQHGYIFENSLAFFPLYPFLVRCLNNVLEYFLCDSLTPSSILLISAISINFATFLAAANIFYTISLRVLDDPKLAYISAMLFCFNPASIFFSAPYSETLFAFLTFSGIRLMLHEKWDVWSSIIFGLAACTRSNGLLNIGFILYKKLKYFLTVLWPGIVRHKLISNMSIFLRTMVKWLLSVIVPSIFIFIPFLAFQADGYRSFCTPRDLNLSHVLVNYAMEHNLIVPSLRGKASRPAGHWCHDQIPFSYSYVQNHYWNVGFLKYFQLAQIPNFLLAIPIVYLIFSEGFNFFRQHKAICLRLGFVEKQTKRKNGTFKMSKEMFVFVMHVVILTLFCFFFIHVQVTTRMLFSASPVPYWFGSYIFYEGFTQKENAKLGAKVKANGTDKSLPYRWGYVNSLNDLKSYINVLKVVLTLKAKILLLYFLSYFVIGAILFSNFLPWT